MSRLRRIETLERIFFTTTNLAAGNRSFSEDERDLLLRFLAGLRDKSQFLLFGYVVMPNHAHLLLLPQKDALPQIMHQWKFKTGNAINRARRTTGAVWQPRYFDFICRRTRDFSNKLEYIHNNPVQAGLVARPEAWKWSSSAYYAGTGVVPIRINKLDFSGDPDELLWPAPWQRG